MNNFFEKYKSDKRIEKEKKNAEKKVKKWQELMEKNRQKAIEKAQDDISIKFERKQRLKSNQIRKQAEIRSRAIVGKKKKIELRSDSIATWRRKALIEFQLYARISRADENGYVTCVDNGERRHYKDRVDGGHIISKHNYPGVAFNITNCRPITKNGNRLQGDSIASRANHVITKTFLNKNIEVGKAIKYTKEDYIYMYHAYKKLNKDILLKINN